MSKIKSFTIWSCIGLLFLRPEPGLYIVYFLIINGLEGFSIYII